jgi:hypothetical protein
MIKSENTCKYFRKSHLCDNIKLKYLSMKQSIYSTLGFMAIVIAAWCCNRPENIIIGSDDVIMLTTPAQGLESLACADFSSSRSFVLPPADSQLVAWAEGRSLANDAIQSVRFEVLRDTGSVSKFTLTFRPLTGKPSEMQCMKGFGCTAPWEYFPWKSPNGNFLDQTVHKFQVYPRGKNGVSFQNRNATESLTIRVNPSL